MLEHSLFGLCLIAGFLICPSCYGSSSPSSGETSSVTSNYSMSTTDSSSNVTDNSTQATSVTPTMASTTTRSPFDVKHNTELALEILELTVGPDNSSYIQHLMANLTRNQLLLRLEVYFSTFSFGVDLGLNDEGQPVDRLVLSIQFLLKDTNDSRTLQESIQRALENIASSEDFDVPSMDTALGVVGKFINQTLDVCRAKNICPLGFTCIPEGCQHMCRSEACSGHGQCSVNVFSTTAVKTVCRCDSEYGTEYLGDTCQYSRRGRLQIIAIIAGVLGAACLVFIIAIIITCVKYGRYKTSSNYNLSGASFTNSAYDNSSNK